MARLVTDPALAGTSGRYFAIERETRSSEESYDRAKAADLWETSIALAALGPEESPLLSPSAAARA
jgi:hypothetical protein